MAAVTEVGSTLLMKCLDFCQALSSQDFNFFVAIAITIAIGPDITSSMDTRRRKAARTVTKKKTSPSTLTRG